MVLLIDLNKRILSGMCRAGDIQKYGLFKASLMFEKKNGDNW
jgi:hypothetical protein